MLATFGLQPPPPPRQNPGSVPALTSLCNSCNLTLQIFSTVTATLSAEVLNVLSREKIQQIISTSGTHVKLVGETLESSSWSDIEKIYSLLAAEVSYVFLPTAREGNVFRGVCRHSVHIG